MIVSKRARADVLYAITAPQVVDDLDPVAGMVKQRTAFRQEKQGECGSVLSSFFTI